MLTQKRLYITPWDAKHISIILRPDLLALASDISFHTVDTYPENNYGYITLPTAEAEKLRGKLHNCVLQGRKMKVEEAKPKKSREEASAATRDGDKAVAQPGGHEKRSPREDGVLPGIILPDERKVKRGWTEADQLNGKRAKRSKGKSDKHAKRSADSITGKEECLFKTKLPPNARPADAGKVDQSKKRKKKSVPNGQAVVHEFKHTVKHATFLREKGNGSQAKLAVEYVDGRGWVDEKGVLIEPEALKAMPHRGNRAKHSMAEKEKLSIADETSSSGTSSSDSDESGQHDVEGAPSPMSPSKEQTIMLQSTNGLNPAVCSVDDQQEPRSIDCPSIARSSATPPSDSSELASHQAQPTEPHPLEAIFKRPARAASHTPKKPALEVSTAFSFFDADNQAPPTSTSAVPQTPFTQQDLRERRQRSAAPTPDTAAPGKTFSGVFGGGLSSPIGHEDEGDSDDDHSFPEPEISSELKRETGGEANESQFAKWFWEHRGENNRAWKRRRREAAKEQRQRENRKRSE